MPNFSITPTTSGIYDVEITDADGSIRRMLGLPDMASALQWIAGQRMLADGAEATGDEDTNG